MKLKTLFIVILACTVFFATVFAQNSNQEIAKTSSCPQCQKTWLALRQNLLKKDLNGAISFFTDSLKKHYESYEISSLNALISEKWFEDPYFIKSIKSENYEFRQRGNDNFRVRITVSYPKKANEEGDASIVYLLDFKLYKSGYKIYMINIAG